MSTSQALKDTAAYLLAQAAMMDGAPVPSGFVLEDRRTWWPAMLAQFDRDKLPHAWRDAGPGVPLTMVGDNDDSPEMDELYRAFGPFMDAATREKIEDSTGVTFFPPWIKKRAGIGPHAPGVMRDEIRRLWESQWGRDWRAHRDNIAAGHVPKAETVAALFAKVYG